MFHWKDMGCKQTAYKNQLKCSMKKQNVNFFTFAVRWTHYSLQGSTALKHEHIPVHLCSGLRPHLINLHKAITASGRSFRCRTYLSLASFYSYYSGNSNYCWLTRSFPYLFPHVKLTK